MREERLYFINEWTDKVRPCLPHLQAWACWLAQPAPEWNRTEAAKHGDTFKARTMLQHDDVTARFVQGRWVCRPTPSPAADFFAMRCLGGWWDEEWSGDTVESALSADDRPKRGTAVQLAVCTQERSERLLRFEVTSEGPRMIDLGPVQ